MMAFLQNGPRRKPMRLCRHAMIALALTLAGCASNDVRPPSPAQNLSPQEMLATPAPPNERYYVMIFGSETCPRVPRHVHSWATVVKVTDQPNCESPLI